MSFLEMYVVTSNSVRGENHKTTVQKGEALAQSSWILFPNSEIPEGDDPNGSSQKPRSREKRVGD